MLGSSCIALTAVLRDTYLIFFPLDRAPPLPFNCYLLLAVRYLLPAACCLLPVPSDSASPAPALCATPQLSLNGRAADGRTYTRPWVLGGRGTGAALATAYASRYPGRVGALMLSEYDPLWRKDRLAFDTFQAAAFASEQEAAAGLNALYSLASDPSRIGAELAMRTCEDECQKAAADVFGSKALVFRMGGSAALQPATLTLLP